MKHPREVLFCLDVNHNRKVCPLPPNQPVKLLSHLASEFQHPMDAQRFLDFQRDCNQLPDTIQSIAVPPRQG